MMTPSACTLRVPPLSGLSAGLQSIDLWFEDHKRHTGARSHCSCESHGRAAQFAISDGESVEVTAARPWYSGYVGGVRGLHNGKGYPFVPSQGAGRIASLQSRVTYKISHRRSRLPRLLHGQLRPHYVPRQGGGRRLVRLERFTSA